MTFREMAQHLGYGELKAVAPITPTPILQIDEKWGARTFATKVDIMFFSKLFGYVAASGGQGRTWT